MCQESKTARTARSSCSRGSWGKPRAGVLQHERLIGVHELAQVVDVEAGIVHARATVLEVGERGGEHLGLDPEHGAPEHLDETTVGVEGEAFATVTGQAVHGLVVQADVQDRLHHARHRELRARAD